MISLNVNQKTYRLEVDPDMPLLWAIRDFIGLTGTKYGCGVAQCGACVIHLNGEAVRSCVTKVKRAEGQKITTIEGLSKNNDRSLQIAWNELSVPQCGYCHSGQIMLQLFFSEKTQIQLIKILTMLWQAIFAAVVLISAFVKRFMAAEMQRRK
jgi:aerobic-type carbon monoxide dehydrogenase small subunit (CoxS/CutS family)